MDKKCPIIDYDKCVACGICEQLCMFGAILMNKKNIDRINTRYPELLNQNLCTSCKLCGKQCPASAISF